MKNGEEMRDLPKVTPKEMFFAFAEVGITGFGGVMPFIFHEIVEKRKWMDEQEFSELIAMGQLLPGANVTNFAAMFGYRLAGGKGSAACLAGLIVPPAIIIYGLFYCYQRFVDNPIFQGALHGVLAVASALIFVTGYKLIRAQHASKSSLIFGLLALVAVGLLRLPLLWVLIVLAPLSFYMEWRAVK